LLENGVQTEVHYPIPPHKQESMLNILNGEYPLSEEIHRTTVSLPIAYFHNEDDIKKVCYIINNYKG
jgi:dTDP-4-amino-4,6-dideoxygalactose transaminase